MWGVYLFIHCSIAELSMNRYKPQRCSNRLRNSSLTNMGRIVRNRTSRFSKITSIVKAVSLRIRLYGYWRKGPISWRRRAMCYKLTLQSLVRNDLHLSRQPGLTICFRWTVCGDIHGQYVRFFKILKRFGRLADCSASMTLWNCSKLEGVQQKPDIFS